MPSIMIDYPDAVWNKQQLSEQLARIAHLFQSHVFKKSTPFTQHSQGRWIELIRSISDLVRQALMAGKRIDFSVDASNQHECRDITNLLDAMRPSAYVLKPKSADQAGLTILSPAFNHVYGTGMGHFANGLFFSCKYRNELTFFIGQDRIYFYRHLMRAYMEAKHYLQSLPLP
jgi:hypothetical protein